MTSQEPEIEPVAADDEWEAELVRAERGSPGVRRWLAYQDRKAARSTRPAPTTGREADDE